MIICIARYVKTNGNNDKMMNTSNEVIVTFQIVPSIARTIQVAISSFTSYYAGGCFVRLSVNNNLLKLPRMLSYPTYHVTTYGT